MSASLEAAAVFKPVNQTAFVADNCLIASRKKYQGTLSRGVAKNDIRLEA